MSFYSCYKSAKRLKLDSIRTSITLMKSVPSFEEGRYVNKSVFEESDFTETPYNSMPITDFSIEAIVAAGGKPEQCYVASSDVDKVMSSVDHLANALSHVEEKQG